MDLEIRDETPADHAVVEKIVEAAFGSPLEARLVADLRTTLGPLISLVAVRDGEVVGHVFFSPVRIADDDARDPPGMGLAPVAVRPDVQNGDIGSQLCRAGVERVRALGSPFCVVLGHTDYYPRFGFTPASEHGLSYENYGPTPAFMVQELEPGGLRGVSGIVHYDPAFLPTNR